MKGFFRGLFLIAAAAASAVSCSKDKDNGKLSFVSSVVYFRADEAKTVGFSSSNVRSYSVSAKPTGWIDPVIDAESRSVRITAPAASNEDAVKSGTLTISGITHGGDAVTASLFVSVSETVDLSDKPANSYVVNRMRTNYLFDAMHKGDGESPLATAEVKVIWQTVSGLIQYLTLADGKASFFIGADEKEEHIQEGNALIGAYDAKGALLWSWHVWAVDYDPEADGAAVAFNGYAVMNRNLGALENSNASTTDILASYGLYYQWGRKDPFIGPSSYQAGSGSSATMYNGSGSRVGLKMVKSSAETGTEEYARKNPLTFITGASEVNNDWLWSASEDLWSERKTVNDPCPYGWKVAPAAAFAGLKITEPLAGVDYSEYAGKYGWTLTDAAEGPQSLFIGSGRRVYSDGKIQNIYVNPDDERLVRNEAMYDQPWIGLYWTADASSLRSSAFYFFFNKLHVENSRVEGIVPHYRSNGMPVRCVADR